jgi:hypothetical protein
VGLLAEWAPEAARVVDIANGPALSAAIADLLEREEQRLRLASKAQERAVAENADVTTRRIRNLYRAMIDARRRADCSPTEAEVR